MELTRFRLCGLLLTTSPCFTAQTLGPCSVRNVTVTKPTASGSRLFCVVTLEEGAEVHAGRNIYMTLHDGAGQLRSAKGLSHLAARRASSGWLNSHPGPLLNRRSISAWTTP